VWDKKVVFKEDKKMLVLSRKEGEKLVIGDNITLVISRITGNRVTVGIEAPADVKIFRGELKGSENQSPKVVPLRRAATVTIDLDDLSNLKLETKTAM
jgi:carbon storage regulator